MTDQEIVAGRGDIAQASGTLGLNIYADIEFIGELQTFSSSADVGQGSGAVAWLTGSFFGGDDAIGQLWDNNGRLALNIYGGCLRLPCSASPTWVRDRVRWPG